MSIRRVWCEHYDRCKTGGWRNIDTCAKCKWDNNNKRMIIVSETSGNNSDSDDEKESCQHDAQPPTTADGRTPPRWRLRANTRGNDVQNTEVPRYHRGQGTNPGSSDGHHGKHNPDRDTRKRKRQPYPTMTPKEAPTPQDKEQQPDNYGNKPFLKSGF